MSNRTTGRIGQQRVMLSTLVAIAGAPIVTILATTNCYAPTEVMVVLSTDLACAERLRTTIFKGESNAGGAAPRFDVTPETETPNCTDPNPSTGVAPDSFIGSIVVTPSSSNAKRAAVKVVLARDKAPSECTAANFANCIEATRSFSFVDHEQVKIPIRLLSECIGTKCQDGFTCAGRGLCAIADCTAGGPGCPLEDGGTSPPIATTPPSPPVSPPVLDAGVTDANVDGPCHRTLASLDGEMKEGRATASATDFYFIRDVKSVTRVPRNGTPSSTIAISNAKDVTALAMDGNDLVVAYRLTSDNSVHIQVGSNNASVIKDYPIDAQNGGAVAADITTIFVADPVTTPPSTPRIYASDQKLVYALRTTASAFQEVIDAGADHIAADTQFVYYDINNGSIFYFRRAQATMGGQLLGGSPKGAAFGTITVNSVSTVYAGGGATNGDGGAVVKLSSVAGSPSIPPTALSVIKQNAVPRSMAHDPQYLYFTGPFPLGGATGNPNLNAHGAFRVHQTTTIGNFIDNEPIGSTITNLTADSTDAGCLYYWVTPANHLTSTLVARPKTK